MGLICILRAELKKKIEMQIKKKKREQFSHITDKEHLQEQKNHNYDQQA